MCGVDHFVASCKCVLGRARAIAMDDESLDEVLAGVQDRMKAKEGEWDDDDYTPFVAKVVLWLHNKGEKKKHVIAAAAGLIVYGATTEEKLQSVAGQPPDDEKFTRKLAAKGVPDAICDLLFEEYVGKSAGKKRARSGGSDVGSDAKRLCIDQDSTGAMDCFIRELNNGVPEEVDGSTFIRFSKALLGMDVYPSLLFIRECYNKLFPMVELMLNDVNEPSKVVLVMGTPGVGKTVFGLYAAFKLLEKGETVMYYHGGEGVYCLLGP